MALSSAANAISESNAPVGVNTTTDPAFDYDQALALSQSAIGQAVGDYELTSADGSAISLDQFRGKPLVLSMVFTSCYQICPMTTRHLSKVVQKARKALGDDSFAVAVVGFDTEVDTPAAMQYFANKQGISDKDWQLLSGNPENIEALSRNLGFQFFPSSNGFDHLIQATVIDAEGRVYRQVYGQVFDTPLLVDPLIELVLGRTPPEQPILANLISKIKLFCTTYDPVRDGYYFDYSLFLGMLIGGTIIVFTGTVVVRGLVRTRHRST
jgi:protein SCO1/2